jgi:membrane protein required for colicin V production
MIIDALIAVSAALAMYKGYGKGIVMAVLSLVGIILGMLLSVKLSGTVAQYLISNNISSAQYATLLSFLVIFIAVVLSMRLLIKFLEGVLKITMLSGVNKLAGSALYLIINLVIASAIIWMGKNIGLIGTNALNDTVIAKNIEPIAPLLINSSDKITPWLNEVKGALQKVGK